MEIRKLGGKNLQNNHMHVKSNDNIIITKADKGGQFILMDKKDYFD